MFVITPVVNDKWKEGCDKGCDKWKEAARFSLLIL